MKSLNCPNCGAALPAKNIKHDIASCEYCATSFRIPKSLTPEPDMGDLLLGADFSSNVMPGWQLFNEDKLTFHKGNPSEMRCRFTPKKDEAFYVLKSSGLLDDFDASVTLRFTEGKEDMTRAGFYLRFTDDGGYTILISAISTYQVGVFTKDKENNKLVWKKIVPWTSHTALKKGFNQNNRLRLICNGSQFRLYFNGVLAASFKDYTWASGKLCLAVDPYEDDGGFALSDLQVREVPGK
jgi:hypothetical protein